MEKFYVSVIKPFFSKIKFLVEGPLVPSQQTVDDVFIESGKSISPRLNQPETLGSQIAQVVFQ